MKMVNPCEITTYKQGSESDYYRYMDGWMDGWMDTFCNGSV